MISLVNTAEALMSRFSLAALRSLNLPGTLMPFSTTKDAQKAKAEKEASDKDKHKAPKPTYTYASPGSSLKEAGYGISMSDPVYVVDPAPKPKEKKAADRIGIKVKPEEIGEDFQQPGSDGVPPPPKSAIS